MAEKNPLIRPPTQLQEPSLFEVISHSPRLLQLPEAFGPTSAFRVDRLGLADRHFPSVGFAWLVIGILWETRQRWDLERQRKR